MKNSKDKEEKIGFEIKNHKLELILPSFIKEKEYNEKKQINDNIRYLKLFRKYNEYSKETNEQLLYKSNNKDSEGYIYSIFEAYYLLLMDYMEFGPFVFAKRKTNTNKRGRINWNSTINKSNLIISNDNLIYNNPYYRNNNILYTHPVTIIYGIHLLQIESSTGLKLNLNSQYKNIIEDNKRSINIKKVLDNYKFSIYSDRELKVFQILETINNNNKNLDKIETNTKLYYLKNINNLWEHMLKVILEDEYYDFNKYFPKGEYYLDIEDQDYIKCGLRIIPDIIKEYNNKLYIIDAKNYLPHINGNIPASGDINKQILYRYFLSKEFNENNKYNLKDIRNIFLLPNDLQGEIIKKIGMHSFINVENTLGDIFVYQVDFDYVVNGYINNNNDIKEEILKTICYD